MSKCLLGDACRYDGQSKPSDAVCKLASKLSYKSVCPEVAGGLSTPRIPSEYDGSIVSNAEGTGVDFAYRLGAQYTVRLAGDSVCCCILKEKSPSCGSEKRYDGTFTSTVIEGEGVTTEALYEVGIPVVSEVVVEEVVDEVAEGINIVFRIDGILPSLANRYTEDLQRQCRDLEWTEAQIVVVNKDMDIPDDKPLILIDVDANYPTNVLVPTVDNVRISHAAKKDFLLSCLVAESLETDNLQYIANYVEQYKHLFAHATLGMDSMPYKDIVAKLYETARSLHDFLLTA